MDLVIDLSSQYTKTLLFLFLTESKNFKELLAAQ